MELMPKGSLYDLLHNGQDLPWSIRYQIALDAASGLRDLHEHKPVILHRDLKSFNILLNDRLRAKLADFGLAKVKHENSSQSSVSKGKVGTLLWMAPELFDDEPKVTAASDIYSFGMVLWELVTRRLPYDKWRPEAAGVRIAQGKKEEIPGDCPAALKKIIESCWQSAPTDRPTAIRVQEDLKPLAKQKVSSPDDSESEIKKLKAEMEQMKLVHERQLAEEKQRLETEKQKEIMQLKLAQEQQSAQLATAEEEKRRLEAEKQAEIQQLKQQNQQHQLELKHAQEDLKRQIPVQPPKSTTPPKQEQELKKPIPPSLSGSSQTLIPAPKPVIPQPDRGIQSVDQKSLSQLLQYVTEGEQDKAEELIQKDKDLLLHVGTVTDLSGREFKQITAFQYALWAMDWHMWTMIQKYLPQEAQAEQLRELETKGTAYGKHFSLQGLTGALQTFVDNAAKWNYDQRAENQWCKKVGGQQKLLPAHIVNEYCRPDRPFDPCPLEWEVKLPRTREVPYIWDSTQSKGIKGSWFIPSSSKDGLGASSAFYRYKYEGAGTGAGLGWRECCAQLVEAFADLKALQSLWKTRTEQLELLKSQLLCTPNQHQRLDAELKHAQDLKYESPVQPPKSTPPLPPVSQIIQQTVMAPPKPASPEQLKLQDQLIAACKQGDEKAVKALLQQDAKPDMANAKGEQPLGAAVWGMCPDVVNALLKQAGGIAPMTWGECEKHNLKYYKEVFIVSKFGPQLFGDWYKLLQKIEPNLFIRSCHLKKVDQQWHDNDSASWENLKRYVHSNCKWIVEYANDSIADSVRPTEEGYIGFRSQIKQSIESAKQPTVHLNF